MTATTDPYAPADVYALHVADPESTPLPDPAEIRALRPGDHVKLAFQPCAPGEVTELMWALIDQVFDGCTYTGSLDNNAVTMPLEHGDELVFSAAHIIAVRPAAPPAANVTQIRKA